MEPTGPKTESPQRRRRWFQFSLRTLFLAMTVFAVWLGMKMHHLRERQQALEMVLGRKGLFSNPSAQDSVRKLSDRRFAQLAYHRARKKALSGDATVSPEEIDRLRTRLLWHEGVLSDGQRPFWCPRWAIPDEAFAEVRQVCLAGRAIADDDVKLLQAFAELEYLDLQGTSITDLGLRHLACLKNLRHLDVSNTNVTDEGVRALQEVLPNCDIHARVVEQWRPVTYCQPASGWHWRPEVDTCLIPRACLCFSGRSLLMGIAEQVTAGGEARRDSGKELRGEVLGDAGLQGTAEKNTDKSVARARSREKS